MLSEYKQYVLNTNSLYTIQTNPFTMYWLVLVCTGWNRLVLVWIHSDAD